MRALITLFAILFLRVMLAATSPANTFVEVRRAEGTGKTTGHVATLHVKNLGSTPTTIAPATYYIPSDLIYQSYVARIEKDFFLAGNAMAEIKLYGYCADVSKPPPPAGKQLTSFDKWVLIVPEGKTNTSDYVLLPDNQRSGWATGEVPRAITFALTSKGDPGVNWPGTTMAVSGTIDPDQQPAETAALLVAYLRLLEKSTSELRERGALRTPFGTDPEKEYASVVQHAFWLTLAKLTGTGYTREDFAFRIRRLAPAAAPKKEDQIEAGINQLWSAFTAVCTNASIL